MKSTLFTLLATAALSLPLFANERINPEGTIDNPDALAKKQNTSEDRFAGVKQSPESLVRLNSWFTDAKFQLPEGWKSVTASSAGKASH